MLDWVMFLSQLGLWVMVIHLYRTRAQERENLRFAAEQRAQEESEQFDFLDSEAVTRMATIRTLLGEIEARTQRLTTNTASTNDPSIPPNPSSADRREELTARPPRPSQWERVGVRAPLPHSPSFVLPTRSPHLASPAAAGEEETASAPKPKANAAEEHLAGSGLDASTIARSTGRQREEVNLLLHLARQSISVVGPSPRTPGRSQL